MAAQRYYDKEIVKQGDCWIWIGQTNSHGVPTVRVDGTRYSVRRLLYIEHYGLTRFNITNICNNKLCVNPEHSKPSNHKVVLSPETIYLLTRCDNGHRRSIENTYDINGVKHCRVCDNSW